MSFRSAMICLLLFLHISLRAASAQVNVADEATIRKIVSDFEVYWTKCDANGLARLWTEDGDFLSPYATFAKDRGEIETFYKDAFASGYCGSNASGTITKVRFVRDDLAIVDGAWDIKGAHDQNSHPVPEEKGRFTAVTKKQSGRWLIVAQREMIPAAQ